jgi:hypothetical protein
MKVWLEPAPRYRPEKSILYRILRAIRANVIEFWQLGYHSTDAFLAHPSGTFLSPQPLIIPLTSRLIILTFFVWPCSRYQLHTATAGHVRGTGYVKLQAWRWGYTSFKLVNIANVG